MIETVAADIRISCLLCGRPTWQYADPIICPACAPTMAKITRLADCQKPGEA